MFFDISQKLALKANRFVLRIMLNALKWDFDEVGNRVYENYNGVEKSYLYNEDNQLIQVGPSQGYGVQLWGTTPYGEEGSGTTYYQYLGYDSRGNCTYIHEEDGTTYLEYNHANLVTHIHYKSGVHNYFVYDSKLRRYAMTDSDGLRYFQWDAENGVNLLAEKDDAGNTVAEYTHGQSNIEGIGSLVASKQEIDGTTYYQYLAFDHRGSVYKVTDEDGNVTQSREYNAWGQTLENDETFPDVPSRYGYHSNWLELKDSARSLILSPSRLYSPTFGKWLQRDPLKMIEVRESLGFYNNSIFALDLRIKDFLGKEYDFVLNNPILFSDPRGLAIPWGKKINRVFPRIPEGSGNKCMDFIKELIEKISSVEDSHELSKEDVYANWLRCRYIDPYLHKSIGKYVPLNCEGISPHLFINVAGFCPQLSQGGQNLELYQHLAFSAAAAFNSGWSSWHMKQQGCHEIVTECGCPIPCYYKFAMERGKAASRMKDECLENIAEITGDILGRKMGEILKKYMNEQISRFSAVSQLIKLLCLSGNDCGVNFDDIQDMCCGNLVSPANDPNAE